MINLPSTFPCFSGLTIASTRARLPLLKLCKACYTLLRRQSMKSGTIPCAQSARSQDANVLWKWVIDERLISASSISRIKYSLAVIRKVAVSHTKPLRSAIRAPVVMKRATTGESPETRSGPTTSGHLLSHNLRCSTTDFQSWTTDRKIFVSATCQC